MSFKSTQKKYHLYVLYDTKTTKPIYIGLSSSLKKRINNHHKSKEFDGVFVIESFESKREGLSAERAIIKFMSMFQSECIVNGLYDRFSFDVINNQIFKIKNGWLD